MSEGREKSHWRKRQGWHRASEDQARDVQTCCGATACRKERNGQGTFAYHRGREAEGFIFDLVNESGV